MSLHAHLHTLEAKHTKLESAITMEAQRPAPDFTYITMLKKQKLMIREESARLSRILRKSEMVGTA